MSRILVRIYCRLATLLVRSTMYKGLSEHLLRDNNHLLRTEWTALVKRIVNADPARTFSRLGPPNSHHMACGVILYGTLESYCIWNTSQNDLY